MEQKQFAIKGEILERTRLNNSACGSPRAEVAIVRTDREGEEVIYAKTATNSAAGWQLGGSSMSYLADREMVFACHETKGGAVIIDKILIGYYDR